MVVVEGALAHQAVGEWDSHVIDETLKLCTRSREQDPTSRVDDRPPSLGKAGDNGDRCLVVDRRLAQRLGAMVQAGEQCWVDRLREDVHRHIDEHRPGLTVLREQERLLDDFGKKISVVDAPRPLDERSIDLELRRRLRADSPLGADAGRSSELARRRR